MRTHARDAARLLVHRRGRIGLVNRGTADAVTPDPMAAAQRSKHPPAATYTENQPGGDGA
jgi:hypothetical protein